MSGATDMSVEELEVGPRTYHALRREGFRTLGDLSKRSARELLRLRRIGVKTVKEIERAMAEHGCGLRPYEMPEPITLTLPPRKGKE